MRTAKERKQSAIEYCENWVGPISPDTLAALWEPGYKKRKSRLTKQKIKLLAFEALNAGVDSGKLRRKSYVKDGNRSNSMSYQYTLVSKE